jgi:hypothetical protein
MPVSKETIKEICERIKQLSVLCDGLDFSYLFVVQTEPHSRIATFNNTEDSNFRLQAATVLIADAGDHTPCGCASSIDG